MCTFEEHGGDPRFLDKLNWIAELHSAKQYDYGAGEDPFANLRASQDFGVEPWVGATIRMNDKITRLKSFIAKGELKNESVMDSFLDIAVYALIASILYEETLREAIAAHDAENVAARDRVLDRQMAGAVAEHDFDDGNGPVPAHQHPNGGGWVAETATVAPGAFVGPAAQVYGTAIVDRGEVVCGADVRCE